MPKFSIKKDDQVKVIAGKDKGKVGRVLRVDRESERVLVEGVNLARKAVRKKRQEDRGGIIDIELPIHISNVMLVTRNGKTTRVGVEMKDGKKTRIARTTGEAV
ncbi:MAG: 50S ribosomal protein L24 [Spirochaetaceae bacterium]|nr:MAG: 50S ribosomal protein L24 [Spirochaetaceae bacterium]